MTDEREWERVMDREQQHRLEPVEGPGDCPSCLRPRVDGHHGCYCDDY